MKRQGLGACQRGERGRLLGAMALAALAAAAAFNPGRQAPVAAQALSLEPVGWNDRICSSATESFRRVSADRKRRNTVLVGGGSGVGALIGGIAGGGRGALIGAGAGAAAGTAGAAATGRRQIRMPAESVVGFRLREPLRIGG